MSQHLITDFIYRPAIFSPLAGEKIINKKLVKYQASNRKNNTSPQEFEESVYDLKTLKTKSVNKTQTDKAEQETTPQHIDISI